MEKRVGEKRGGGKWRKSKSGKKLNEGIKEEGIICQR